MAQYSQAMLVREEAVTFHNGSVTLAGTLMLPQLNHPCPGVVLVHGSGDDTRNDYRELARHFAEHGIAALIYDKRGVGASTGSWRAGTFVELAEDALAGIHVLAQRSEVDSRRVGLWGFSEGGWVAPLAASKSSHVRFLVAVSPPGMSPALQEEYRRMLLINENSASRMHRIWRMTGMRLMFGVLRHAPKRMLPGLSGYFARTLDYDPLPVWKAITQPTLLIFGAEDKAVPPQRSAAMIEHTLQEGEHSDYTIQVFPDADHGIRIYDAETQKRILAPGYLDALTTWIAAR